MFIKEVHKSLGLHWCVFKTFVKETSWSCSWSNYDTFQNIRWCFVHKSVQYLNTEDMFMLDKKIKTSPHQSIIPAIYICATNQYLWRSFEVVIFTFIRYGIWTWYSHMARFVFFLFATSDHFEKYNNVQGVVSQNC